MSNEKLIPEYRPPAYAQAVPPVYHQPPPPVYHQPPPAPHAYATAPPPYQGTVAPEYQQPVGTTRTVIVTERVGPTTQVYVNPVSQRIVVNPFLWIYVFLSILFCPILGCIALCFLIMASSDQENGRYVEAVRNARVARMFAGFGIFLCVLIIAINVVLNFTVYHGYDN